MSYMTGPLEWDVPKPFDGTDDEKKANYETHEWMPYEVPVVMVCRKCDAKDWHVAATYPCGVEPERMIVVR